MYGPSAQVAVDNNGGYMPVNNPQVANGAYMGQANGPQFANGAHTAQGNGQQFANGAYYVPYGNDAQPVNGVYIAQPTGSQPANVAYMAQPNGSQPANGAYMAQVNGPQMPMAQVPNMADAFDSQVNFTLGAARGVVFRQIVQVGESVAQAVGIPYEAKNKYKVALLPEGKLVGDSPGDRKRWKPTGPELEALDTFLFAQEESTLLTRLCFNFLGLGNLRPLTLHFRVGNRDGDVFVVRRPFQCGGWVGCPLEMPLHARGQDGSECLVGRVREDFDDYLSRFAAACCACTFYHSIEVAQPSATPEPAGGGGGGGGGNFRKVYSLRANACCCGRVNNCCGATCCCNDMVFDVLDSDGRVVAHLQKTYATAPCCAALFRCCYMFNNYTMDFPAGSTPEERALLLTAIFQLDYQLFEKKGGDS